MSGEVKIGGHCDCHPKTSQDDLTAKQLGHLCLEMMSPGTITLSRLQQIEPSLEDSAGQPETAVAFLKSTEKSTIREIQSVSLLPHVNLTALMELWL